MSRSQCENCRKAVVHKELSIVHKPMTTKIPSLSTDLSLPEVLKEAAVQRCSENMPQVYRRIPTLKRDFNKVALLLYWNRTSAWVFSCKFAIYFQNNFPKNTYARLLLYSLSTSATITVTQPKMKLNICYGITCYNKRWNMLQFPFFGIHCGNSHY